MNTTGIEEYIEKATAEGKRAGINSAYWICQDSWGGRSGRDAKEIAESVIKRIDDGDPAIYDAYELPNLSGEWGGDLTPSDLFWICCRFEYDPDIMEHQFMLDEICTAWETAVSEHFFETIYADAKSFLFNK